MTAIAAQRLDNQRLTRQGFRQPADVVSWLGAVQAQEYAPAKWALGLRMSGRRTDSDIQQAFDEGRILRTHVMRPTWHFVTPADIRWMLELTAPRVGRTMASYHRRLGLDSATLTRATGIFEQSLDEGRCLTRAELAARLARAGIVAKGIPLAMLTIHAELQGVMCSGPRRGNQMTYARLADRAPDARRLSRDEALAELTRRYFRSHGPATIRDFVWWSGLTVADAKRGLDLIRAKSRAVVDLTYWTVGEPAPAAARRSAVHLLPVYDEYLVAYRDREAVPHAASTVRLESGRIVNFLHAVVIGGQIAGTWKPVANTKAITVNVVPLRRLSRSERQALSDCATRYGEFVGVAEAAITI